MSQEATKTKRPDRSVKKRVPLGARNRLSFSDLDERFNYRVINDQEDRLSRAEDAGYEFVESDSKLGDTRVAEGSVPGSKVAKPVGNNVTGYLMRIPKKFYDEDQAAKVARIQETEDSMQPDAAKAQYGGGLSDE
jgi:hypothetical protein